MNTDQTTKKKVNLLLAELNMFRKYPQKLIPFLNNRKTNYSTNTNKNILFSPYHPSKGLSTKQGTSTIPDLIGELYTHDSMCTLQQNQHLSFIAQNLANSFKNFKLTDIKLTQQLGEYLRNKLNESKLYNFTDKVSCLIGIGFQKEEYQPLLSLLLDDGNKERKNRRALFNGNFRFVGMGTVTLSQCPEMRIGVYLLTTNIGLRN